MKMKNSESLHLKKLKANMLHTLPDVLKLPNLQEKDRFILADILADMLDEHTPYKKRLAAFSMRQYVIDEIKQKYGQSLNTNPLVGQYFNSYPSAEDQPF